mgnify:CR=1 FL=1
MKPLPDKEPWINYALVLRADLEAIRRLKQYLATEGIPIIFDRVSSGFLWVNEGERKESKEERNQNVTH